MYRQTKSPRLNYPKIILPSGYDMPQVGLGTYQAKSEDVQMAVETAIDEGYRHFDTAPTFLNEKAIGEALERKISNGSVARRDLFITTKLHYQHMARRDVKEGLKASLKRLGLKYVDLYLIQGPTALKVI